MKITSFWAKGYRSLRDVRIDGFGEFNVFYGPNGAGKSNIFAGIETAIGLLGVRSQIGHTLAGPSSDFFESAHDAGVIGHDDISRHSPSRRLVLGIRLGSAEGDEFCWAGPLRLAGFECELVADYQLRTLEIALARVPGAWDLLALESVRSDYNAKPVWVDPEGGYFDQDGPAALDQALVARIEQEGHRLRPDEALDHLRRWMRSEFIPHTFALVGANRSLGRETEELSGGRRGTALSELFEIGCLKEGLFRAFNHPDIKVRKRVEALQLLLSGEPLERPPFRPVQDPATKEFDLREELPGVAGGGDISLDLAGLGIAQVYSILAQILLRGTTAVAIEEPEAHLHAPTTGRHLRELLVRLVKERHVEQLFIATHSNLYDLDEDGYFDVSLGEGGTRVERASLAEIDARHLFEPGPAKHAIQDFLSIIEDQNAIVFRDQNEGPISAKEMLVKLQRDDADALAFLRDVNGAAVRVVRVRSQKPASGS